MKIRLAIILSVCYGVYLLGQSLEEKQQRSIASEKPEQQQTLSSHNPKD